MEIMLFGSAGTETDPEWFLTLSSKYTSISVAYYCSGAFIFKQKLIYTFFSSALRYPAFGEINMNPSVKKMSKEPELHII